MPTEKLVFMYLGERKSTHAIKESEAMNLSERKGLYGSCWKEEREGSA